MRWIRKDSNLTWWCNQSVIMLRMVDPEDSSIYLRYHSVSFGFSPSISWSLVFFTRTEKSSPTSHTPPPPSTPRCVVYFLYNFTEHAWVLISKIQGNTSYSREYVILSCSEHCNYTDSCRKIGYGFLNSPRSQGFFPLFKKPWERGCKVPSPWIGSTSSPGRFSATSNAREKRPGDEVGIGYPFWYYFLLIGYLKKKKQKLGPA